MEWSSNRAGNESRGREGVESCSLPLRTRTKSPTHSPSKQKLIHFSLSLSFSLSFSRPSSHRSSSHHRDSNFRDRPNRVPRVHLPLPSSNPRRCQSHRSTSFSTFTTMGLQWKQQLVSLAVQRRKRRLPRSRNVVRICSSSSESKRRGGSGSVRGHQDACRRRGHRWRSSVDT